MGLILCTGSENRYNSTLIEQVLQILVESNLKSNSAKCVFAAEKVVFLGHIISESGIQQNPEKLAALIKMPPPNDVNGVRRILGMAGYDC